MKILIWIKREDAVTGDINKYHTVLPHVIGFDKYEWVQVEITQNEFTLLEDGQ
jgi:hypothetical protein